MTRIRASVILIAFAFAAFAAPLVASAGMCRMECCKHAKSTAIQAPMCPLPQQHCPSVKRDVEPASGTTATPAAPQPVVHAAPAIVATCSAGLRPASTRPPGRQHYTADTPIYLVDSVFRI